MKGVVRRMDLNNPPTAGREHPALSDRSLFAQPELCLQQAFSTVSLSFSDWLRCAGVASSVLWLRELSKVVTPAKNHLTTT